MPSLRAYWCAVCLAVSIYLLIPLLLIAQSTGGRILGRVSDPTGAVLADVKVTLTNEATGVSAVTTSNGNGDYVYPQVVVGSYRM